MYLMLWRKERRSFFEKFDPDRLTFSLVDSYEEDKYDEQKDQRKIYNALQNK